MVTAETGVQVPVATTGDVEEPQEVVRAAASGLVVDDMVEIPDLETPTQHQVASSRSKRVESIPRIQPGCAIASFEGGNQRQCAVQEILECGAHRLVQSANIGGVTSTPECAMDIEVADFGSNGPVPGSSTRARKDDDDCSVVRISPSCSTVDSDFAGLMYQTTEDASSRVQAGSNQVAGRSTRARKDDDDLGVVRISPSCSAVGSDFAGQMYQTTEDASSRVQAGSNQVAGRSTRARKDDDDRGVVRISPSCSAVGSDFAGLMYQTTEDASSRVQAGSNQVAGRSTRARKDDDDRGVVRISPSCSAVDSDFAGLVSQTTVVGSSTRARSDDDDRSVIIISPCGSAVDSDFAGLMSQTTVVGSSTRARSDDDDRSVILISPCGSAVDSDFAGLMSQTTVGSNRRSFGSFLFQKGRTSPGICTVDTDFVGRCL